MPPSRAGWLLGGLATVAAAIALALGLSAIDAPWTARQRRLDQRRVSDLSLIADAVDRHWTRHRSLPETIDEAGGTAAAALTTADPFSNAPYEYRRGAADAFRLCATFSEADPEGIADYRAGRNAPRRWQHGDGHQCFDLRARVLDPPPGG